ncbi:MAG TPA: hypothetical protein VMS17_26415 [Gemmataceae bacterium]|nr:hypothetical protein [Gemmataceae bacterium]
MKALFPLGRAAALLLAGVYPAALLLAPSALRAQPPGFAYPPAPSLSSIKAAAATAEPPLADPAPAAPAAPAATATPPAAVSIAPGCGAPIYPVPGCPWPYTPIAPGTPGQTNPENPMGTQPPNPELNPNAPESANPSPETVGITAPNVIGDLLFTSRSASFGFVRTNGFTNFQGLASTSIVNSNVDENNSPLPENRIYFRYNFYDNSQSVTGLSNATAVQIPSPGAGIPAALVQLPAIKNYDTSLYTFGAEKTFLDGFGSLEFRVPVITSLASHNTLSVASFAGAPIPSVVPPTPGLQDFSVNTTPGATLGHEDTEFGNLTLVLKGLFYRDTCSGLYLSGGTGLLLPTGEDTHLTAVDVANFAAGDPNVNDVRVRGISIVNETWSLSPFLAALYAPNDRFFTQGFAAIEIPLGASRVNFQEQNYIIPTGAPLSPASLTPFPGTNNPSARAYINEQSLVHLDWDIGYWAYRCQDDRMLTGIAPCLELHYTGTLRRADAVVLPSDGALINNPANLTGPQIPAPPPVVGGTPSTINIVDLTAGATWEFGRRTTLATAFSVPLTNQTNRTFDWEFQLQLNYYFGR